MPEWLKPRAVMYNAVQHLFNQHSPVVLNRSFFKIEIIAFSNEQHVANRCILECGIHSRDQVGISIA